MRKYVYIGMMVSLIVSAAPVICTRQVVSASEAVKLSLWTEWIKPPQTQVFEELILGFQEEYPWILVEHRGINNEVWEETLRTALYSENPPDIFVTESRAELLEYVNAGLLYDLSEWYAAHSDRFMPGHEFNSVVKGRRYAIPWHILTLDLIWYNPRIMGRHNLDPTTIHTWDDLMAMCETLKQHGEIPFAFGGGGAGWTGGHWVMFLLQKHFTPEDIIKLARREKHWTDPDVVAALSHFEELVKKGYLAPDAAKNDRNAGLKQYFQNQGAFWQAGSWHLYQKRSGDAPPDWKFTFIPFPDFADTPVQHTRITSSYLGWAVSNKSTHSKEVTLFLEYITRLSPSAELWVKETQDFLTIRGAVNEHTAGPEMVAIARDQESSHIIEALEFYLPREVVQEGHWKGSLGVLSGQMTTQEWAELIEELHKANGVLMLE